VCHAVDGTVRTYPTSGGVTAVYRTDNTLLGIEWLAASFTEGRELDDLVHASFYPKRAPVMQNP